MHFICRSFIGKDNPQFWSQTWENEPDNSFPPAHLFGLISLKNNNGDSDLKILGREIIDQINQLFFSSSAVQINQKIDQTINQIIENYPSTNIDLSILISSRQQIFAAVYGQTQIILQRNSQISRLVRGFPNQFFQVSGPTQTGDKFILSTNDFVDQIGWEKIKSTVIETKIQNIEETFLSSLYSLENQDNLSSFLVEVCSDETNDSFSPISEEPSIQIDPPAIQPQPPSQPLPQTETIPASHHQPQIYVKNRFKFKIGNHKKIQLIVALFLLLGLMISFYFGYQKNQTQKAETSFQTLKTELENKLNNIAVVKNLNIETAYQSAKEAQDIISKMSQLQIHSDEISQYKSQVDLILSQSGDSSSFKPESVYDTSLIINHPNFSKIVFSKNTLYLLDSSNGRIDSLIPQDKSTKNLIISDQVKSGSKILVDSNNFYLLSGKQVFLIEKNNLSSKIDLNSSSLTVTDAHFWNGSLYVLDRDSQSIWKLTPSASGFSTPQSWLKNDAKLELGVTSLSIDGQVWVLTESGQIYLYTSGVKDKFKQSQEISFTKATNLTADADSDYLVFSDNSKLIYVYKKTGEFGFKFNLGDLQVLDVTFDSTNKIIYFLASDQKIYKISL